MSYIPKKKAIRDTRWSLVDWFVKQSTYANNPYSGYTVGTLGQPLVDGTITGIRFFWVTDGGSQTVTCKIWDKLAGTTTATTNAVTVTSSGAYVASLSTPLSVSALTQLVLSGRSSGATSTTYGIASLYTPNNTDASDNILPGYKTGVITGLGFPDGGWFWPSFSLQLFAVADVMPTYSANAWVAIEPVWEPA